MKFLQVFCLALPILMFVPVLRAQSESTVKQVKLTFTSIDYPGEAITNIHGINTAGDMVGNYAAATNAPSHGFLYSGGTFTTIDYPGGDDTLAIGINDSGLISGNALINQSTGAAGFTFDGTKFTSIQLRGQSATLVYGINNAGIVVGADGSLAATEGFELAGKHFHQILPPGNYCSVYANAINNLGEVVGSVCGAAGEDSGFVLKNGQYQFIGVTGANDSTIPSGVNDKGIVVGYYGKGVNFIGFAFINGKYLTFSYPGALYTFALGINSNGQIVGSYSIDLQTYHGFVSSPIAADDF